MTYCKKTQCIRNFILVKALNQTAIVFKDLNSDFHEPYFAFPLIFVIQFEKKKQILKLLISYRTVVFL